MKALKRLQSPFHPACRKASLFLCTLLLLLACSDDHTHVLNVEPVLTVEPAEVTVGAGGGACSVTYQVENPVKDANVKASTSADWITHISTLLDGHVAFNVSSNWNGEDREATVTLEYTGASPVDILVKQTTAATSFQITATERTESKISVRVQPNDTEMRYLTMLLPKSYMDAYGTNDELVYQDDMEYFKKLAEQLEGNFADLIENSSFRGTCETTYENLTASTTYCVYCYGIDKDLKRTTPITRAYFTTGDPVGLNNQFDINFDVDGVEITMQVIPENAEYGYYFNMLEGTPTDQEILTKMEDYFNQILALYAQYGYTKEQTLEAMLQKGTQQYTYNVCKPNTTYTGFAFAMSPSGVMSKKVTTKVVQTEGVKQSDMTLEVEVKDIKPRTAILACHPSKDNERYALAYVEADGYKNRTDDEVAQILTQAVQQGIIVPGYGEYEETLSGLTPGTEYEALAMGVNGSYASTPLVRHPFRTADEKTVDYYVDVTCDKYFSADQAADKFGGALEDYRQYAIVPVAVSPTNGAQKIYYTIFMGDVTDTNAYTDDVVISNLLGGYTAPKTDIFCEYYEDLTLCAVSADEEGNFGKVYRQYLTLDPAGVSPIDEYEPAPLPNSTRRKAAKLFTRPVKKATLLPRNVKAMQPQTLTTLQMADPTKDQVKGAFKNDIMQRRLHK